MIIKLVSIYFALFLISNQVGAEQMCSWKCTAHFDYNGWVESPNHYKDISAETYDFDKACKNWCAEESQLHDGQSYSKCQVLESSCIDKLSPPVKLQKTCCGEWSCNQTCPTYIPGCWPGGGSFTVIGCAQDTPADGKALCFENDPYVTYGIFMGDKSKQCQ